MNDTDREAVETLLSMSRQRDRMQQVTSSDEEESSCSSSSLHWDESSQDENKDRNKLMSYSAKVGVSFFFGCGCHRNVLHNLLYSQQNWMESCATPPRTPSPATVTSMPVSVIMLGKRDGTAEPLRHQYAPVPKNGVNPGERIPEKGSRIIFVENKNTNRSERNINFSEQQIFVANKDTNREALSASGTGRPVQLNAAAVPEGVKTSPPIAIAPKVTLTAARMIPMTASNTLFLAPCDSNGQITHFVLATTAANAVPHQVAPSSPAVKVFNFILNFKKRRENLFIFI